jgi:hypothetical protein
MCNTGRKNEPPKKAQESRQNEPRKPLPPSRSDDDDYEDGDIATPKRDRTGNDDEPL